MNYVAVPSGKCLPENGFVGDLDAIRSLPLAMDPTKLPYELFEIGFDFISYHHFVGCHFSGEDSFVPPAVIDRQEDLLRILLGKLGLSVKSGCIRLRSIFQANGAIF